MRQGGDDAHRRLVEAPNGFGDTLGGYRTAASGLTSGRAYLTYVDNSGLVSGANHSADGIHVNTTGAAQIGAAKNSNLP